MVDNFYSHERTKTYDIPLTNLDFKYINACESISELERILKTLRSGEVGRYTELEQCCEDRIRHFDPEHRLLRKAVPLGTICQLVDEERNELMNGFEEWLSEMKDESNEPDSIANCNFEMNMLRIREPSRREDLDEEDKTIEYDEELPPVRRELVFKSNSRSATRKANAGDGFAGKRVIKPRDYNEWDKLEKEWDKELNEEAPATKQQDTSTHVTEKGEHMTLSESETRNLSKLSCRDLAKRAANMPEQTRRQLALREKEKGNEAFHAGDYNEALVYYKRSLTLHPTIAVYNNRALIYLHQKEWSLAVKDCARVLKEEPDNPKALFRSGRANYELHNLDDAEKALERLTDQDPTFTKAQNLLRTVRAEKANRQTQRLQGGRRMIITDVGTSSDSSEEEESSESDERTSAANVSAIPIPIESQNPEPCKPTVASQAKPATVGFQNVPVSSKSTANKSALKPQGEKITHCNKDRVRRRVVYPPSNPGPYGREGMVIEEISDTESTGETKPEQEAKNSEDSHPAGDGSTRVTNKLRQEEFKTNVGIDQDAMLVSDASKPISSMNYQEAKKRGEILRNQKNLTDAFTCYTRCIDTARMDNAPDKLAIAYRNRAIVALDLSRYQQAVDDCTEALKVEPGHPTAFYRRALGRRALGDLEGTVADLEEAHRLLPTSNNIKTELETARQLLRANTQNKELGNQTVSTKENAEVSDYEVVTISNTTEHSGRVASSQKPPTSISPDPGWDIVNDMPSGQEAINTDTNGCDQDEVSGTALRNAAIEYLGGSRVQTPTVTPSAFQTRWTGIGKMPKFKKFKEVVELLYDVQPERLIEIIGIKLEASMLDEIIQALEWLYSTEDPGTLVSEFTYNTLLQLSRIPRFQCGLLLITDETIRAINILFQCLEQNPGPKNSKERVLELKQMYTIEF